MSGVGPRVAAEFRDREELVPLPCRLPRVGACAFSLSSISLQSVTVSSVSEQSLWSVLFSMEKFSATGSDGVSIRILKLCFGAIGHVLLFILNSCLTSCEVPEFWKYSLVLTPSRYPVVLANHPNSVPSPSSPPSSSIVEKVAQQQLYAYMAGNHLFSSSHQVTAPTTQQKPRLPPYPTTSFPPRPPGARPSVFSTCPNDTTRWWIYRWSVGKYRLSPPDGMTKASPTQCISCAQVNHFKMILLPHNMMMRQVILPSAKYKLMFLGRGHAMGM